jgi:hypothetical protein|tara:strand:+ start:11075 stop:11335 length:261 start_codon:yes stop_codon:yes gene_type:complete
MPKQQMKKVTVTEEQHKYVLSALEGLKDAFYLENELGKVHEIFELIKLLTPKNGLIEKSRFDVDVNEEIQRAQGTLVAGCKGGDCD